MPAGTIAVGSGPAFVADGVSGSGSLSRVCLPSRAFNDRRVRGSHLRVLAAIAELGEGGLARHQIAAACGMDDRHSRRHVNELVEFGYLLATKVPGFVSVYRIVFEAVEGGHNLPHGQEMPRGQISPRGQKLPRNCNGAVPPDGPPPLPPETPLNPPPLNPPSRHTGRARATRLPDDWLPSPANIAYAESRGFVDDMLSRQIEDFRDYWHARAGPNALKLDWSKTWATWIRKAADWKADGNGRHRQNSHDAEIAAFDFVSR